MDNLQRAQTRHKQLKERNIMRVENGEMIDEGETELFLVKCAEAYAKFRWPELSKTDHVLFSQNIELSLRTDPGASEGIIGSFLARVCDAENNAKHYHEIMRQVQRLKDYLLATVYSVGSDILTGEFTPEMFFDQFKKMNDIS